MIHTNRHQTNRYQIGAVIFDLDGTLLYTLPDITRAINTVLRRSGYPEHSENEYRQLVGHGLRESIKNALPSEARGDELLDRLAAELIAEYDRDPAGSTVPYEGIPELLDYLRAHSIPAAVLTNKRQEIARQVVRRVLPDWEFDLVIGDGGDFPRKPDTTAVHFIGESMGTKPEQVLFLGDSGVDMMTAVQAGMVPGGVLWGYREKEELEAAGARLLFTAPVEIVNFLSG